MWTEKKVKLESSDGEVFEISVAEALQVQPIRHKIKSDCAHSVIPLPITGKILSKVIEYCRKHKEAQKTRKAAKDDLKSWDAEFVKVGQGTLCELIRAASYLGIKSLLRLTCQTIVDNREDFSLWDICDKFGIMDDFTSEEKEEVQRENQWHLSSEEEEEVCGGVMSTEKKVTLKSSVGEVFEISKALALQFQLNKHTINDYCARYPNMTGQILSKVIEYCQKHVEAEQLTKAAKDDLEAWDADFVKVEQATLFDLIPFANFLKIRSLRDLTSQALKRMIRKTAMEIPENSISNGSSSDDEEGVPGDHEEFADLEEIRNLLCDSLQIPRPFKRKTAMEIPEDSIGTDSISDYEVGVPGDHEEVRIENASWDFFLGIVGCILTLFSFIFLFIGVNHELIDHLLS